ncbi:MAG TPA: glycerol-3-phosphate 1-O-acyltransferase PlsY [Firmicutes bacterium]|nr:glycerol-3-phosphate 1-O-acyltransferase PlsY [Bacillota bacterium]
MNFFFVLLISYLIGSIPFGLLFGRWWANIDVRQFGSGNIGMTNVLRSAGTLPAALTLLGDCGKGAVAVLLAKAAVSTPFLWLLAGTAAVMGHNWPVFLKFKGGKGVATIAGVLFTLWPVIALVLAAIWVLVLILFRYISLSSIAAACSLPLLLLIFRVGWLELALGAVVAAFTIYRHRDNIERLRQGTEFRFGERVNS